MKESVGIFQGDRVKGKISRSNLGNAVLLALNDPIFNKNNVTLDMIEVPSGNKFLIQGEENLVIKEEDYFESFWNDILIPNLKDKYNSKPVHSLDEIIALKVKFPDNIKHFNVYHNDKLVCGTTLFFTKNVVKPQYISGNESNNLLGSIDYLYDFLINEVSKGKEYFDFGPSHENNGLNIVKNINFWKESFGANTLVQDFYEVETSNYQLLDTILI